MTHLFTLPEWPSVPVLGEDARFPVRRIFCVGRNYEAHAREMGFSVDRDAPFYFTKTPSAVCPGGSTIAYPPGTANCHYEMELVVAIGAPAFRIAEDEALSIVLGYACGLDLTRRDLQNEAKKAGQPWDVAKAFDNSAPVGALTPVGAVDIKSARIWLSVNGVVKQDANLDEMIWNVSDIVTSLSRAWDLRAGDLIFTGTPSGVGPLQRGDRVSAEIAGLSPLAFTIAP